MLDEQLNRGAPGLGLKVVRALTNSWEGVGGGFTELDVEFRFAKIQNFHLWGGGGFAEFDVQIC